LGEIERVRGKFHLAGIGITLFSFLHKSFYCGKALERGTGEAVL